MNRRILAGLAVVAGCAAVLSFSAIRGLALTCGFSPALAWLLPVCVDVGAAVATALWLATDAPQVARDYARTLAFALLVASIAANGLSHGLSAYQLAPPWWVVVLVSAVPALVLGACVHLVVLARPTTPTDQAGTAVGLGSDPAVPADPAPDLPVEGPVPGAAPAGTVVDPPQEQHPLSAPSGELDVDDDDAVTAWAVDRLRRGEHAGAGTLQGLDVPKRRAERLARAARDQLADEQTLRAVR